MVDKIKKVMGEFKSGVLKSASGKPVVSQKQAIAIALSEKKAQADKKKKAKKK